MRHLATQMLFDVLVMSQVQIFMIIQLYKKFHPCQHHYNNDKEKICLG